jgi:hypothetical protein
MFKTEVIDPIKEKEEEPECKSNKFGNRKSNLSHAVPFWKDYKPATVSSGKNVKESGIDS